MPIIYTAQYKYRGQDRLDITVKGQDPVGRAFAPTWSMVTLLKKGVMSEKDYMDQYYRLINRRWEEDRSAWDYIWSQETVTLVCFCPVGAFCHRYLLQNILIHQGAERGQERRM